MTNKNTHRVEDEISIVFSDTVKLTQIIQKGIQAALLKHKQAGNPICEWRDNKVVWIPPEKIAVNIKRDETDEKNR